MLWREELINNPEKSCNKNVYDMTGSRKIADLTIGRLRKKFIKQQKENYTRKW